MEMTGGQALAQQLVREGVRHVFGIPGVQLDWATDALLDVADSLHYVVPRHEQATSYMADGYARSSGEIGVCMVVPGPGLLNAMAGLATAYACSSRLLCISGQIPSATIGRGLGMLHEVRNQSTMLGSVTKWSALATTPAEIPGLVNEAFRQLRSGHPRPVGLEIPPDVLQARAEVELLDPAPMDLPAEADAAALQRAAALLRSARFPVIFAGGGAVAAHADAALRRLGELLQAPVVTSPNGYGALPTEHPLALSALGGRCVLPHADVVLVVGSRFLDAHGVPVPIAPGASIIYLNIEPADLGAPRLPGLALCADARCGLERLAECLDGLSPPPRQAMVAQVRAWCDQQLAFIEPQMSYVRALRSALPDDGVLVGEMTQVGYASGLAFPVRMPGSYLHAGYQGTLGFGFPSALGAATADPQRPVISINGDGGFGWNLQELATLARDRPRLVVVVFNDGAFGNVRRIQRGVFKREIATELHNPDFVALAEAFGLPASRVDSPAALEAAIRQALQAGGPALIEVKVGEMPGPWHLIHSFSKAPRPAPPNPLGPAT